MASGEDKNQKELQKLLKMSLKLTDQELQTYANTEMGEERKKWLQDAITHVLENDDGKKLTMFSEMLFTYNPTSVFTDSQLADLENVLDAINFLCEGMDMGLDFNKMGGLKFCLDMLKHTQYPSLQWRTADLIANCTQNSPKCQNTLLENNGIVILLKKVRETDIETVRIKTLYALSSAVGSHEAAEKLFIRLKGINQLLALMSNENVKLRLKSSFFLRKLICSDFAHKEINYAEVANKLVELLRHEHDETHENIAGVLLFLMQKDDVIKSQCKNSDVATLLQERITELGEKDAEMYEKEIDIYMSIAKL